MRRRATFGIPAVIVLACILSVKAQTNFIVQPRSDNIYVCDSAGNEQATLTFDCVAANANTIEWKINGALIEEQPRSLTDSHVAYSSLTKNVSGAITVECEAFDGSTPTLSGLAHISIINCDCSVPDIELGAPEGTEQSVPEGTNGPGTKQSVPEGTERLTTEPSIPETTKADAGMSHTATDAPSNRYLEWCIAIICIMAVVVIIGLIVTIIVLDRGYKQKIHKLKEDSVDQRDGVRRIAHDGGSSSRNIGSRGLRKRN